MAEGYYLTQQDRDLLDAKIAEVTATLHRLNNFTAGGAAGFLNTAQGIAIDYAGRGISRRKSESSLVILNNSGEDKKRYHVLAVKSVLQVPTVASPVQSAAQGGQPITPPDLPPDYSHATPAIEGENPSVELAYGQASNYREGRMVVLLEDVNSGGVARCIGDGYALVQIWAAGDISTGQMRWAAVVDPGYLPSSSGDEGNPGASNYLVAVADDWGSGVQVVWADVYSSGEAPKLIWALVRLSAPSQARLPVFAVYADGEMVVYRAKLGPGQTDGWVQSETVFDAPHELGWTVYEPGFYWAQFSQGRWVVPGRQPRVGNVTAGSGPSYTVQPGTYIDGTWTALGSTESALNIYEDVGDINTLKPGAPDSAVLTKGSVRGKVLLERLDDRLVFWAPVTWDTECGE